MKARVMQHLRRAQEKKSTGRKFRFDSPSLNPKQFNRNVMLIKAGFNHIFPGGKQLENIALIFACGLGKI